LESYVDFVIRHAGERFEPSWDELAGISEHERALINAAMTELADVFERRRAQKREPPTNFDPIDLNGRSYGLGDVADRLGLRRERPNDIRPFLRRAALLHAEALAVYADSGLSTAVLRHQGLGGDLATVLAERCRDNAFAAAWWYAVGGRLSMSAPWVALTLLTDGLSKVAEDSRLRFALGAVEELLASPRVQDAIAASTAGPRWQEWSNVAPPSASPNVHLNKAADHLRRAIGAEPHSAEGHLRLGRVLALLGNVGGAREHLARARQEAAGDVFVTYHASLLMGDVEQRAGRAASAEAEVHRALALVPTAQAPRLALSHLLRTSGRSHDALDVLTAYFSSSPPGSLGDEQDPWLSYGLGAGRLSDEMLKELKAGVDQ
jgi:tetratricopeptide (TPR) repeat protein